MSHDVVFRSLKKCNISFTIPYAWDISITMKQKTAIKSAAAILGKLGGSVKSQAKAIAARRNGKKGGRPVIKGEAT